MNPDIMNEPLWAQRNHMTPTPPRSCDSEQTYVVQELLQALLELVEVAGGDEALAALLQTVPGQLHQLMVNEAQDAVGQRARPLRVRGGQQLGQTLLHLSRCLGKEGEAGVSHRRGDHCSSNRLGVKTNSEGRGHAPTLGKRSLYTWFIMTISWSKEMGERPGLKPQVTRTLALMCASPAPFQISIIRKWRF